MSGDQRLLALEVTAHAFSGGGTPGTLVTRGQLVDSYNFLSLPKTGVVGGEGLGFTERKARYYVYEVLRAAAISGSVDLGYLEMLEAAVSRRSQATDSIIDQMKEIKLRLE
jgi:hypothetical protein